MNDKRRIAQSCRAWLVNIEELNDEGRFMPTSFRESVPLIWSYDAEADSVDIPQGIRRYVDLDKWSDSNRVSFTARGPLE